MAFPSKHKWLVVSSLWMLFAPVSARADAINVGFFLGYGASILIPLLTFQTAVETLILRGFINVHWRAIAIIVLWANIWSVIAGIPTKFLNAAIYDTILPRPLHDYMRLLPAAAIVATCVFFCVTIAVEWLVTREKFRLQGVIINGSRPSCCSPDCQYGDVRGLRAFVYPDDSSHPFDSGIYGQFQIGRPSTGRILLHQQRYRTSEARAHRREW